MLQKEATRN